MSALPDRTALLTLLGNQHLDATGAEVTPRTLVDGWPLSDLTLTLDDGTRVPALFLGPPGGTAPVPAVLYCHAHGNRYDIGRDELVIGRPALQGPYAGDLRALGCAVLCLEMPCFGQRADPPEGPAAKAGLWWGRPLFGRMLAELGAGARWLMAQPEIDAARVATMGISMGGTHAWWLAALEQRIAAAVHMCCFADLATLVQSGAHDGHGAYMTVPGLLPVARSGQIAGLIAPRPQLVCAGMADWSTPPGAFARAMEDLAAAYGPSGGPAHHVENDLGHAESPAMRAAVLAFLARVLAN